MAKREHTLTVGRYRVIGDYEAVAIDDDGTLDGTGLCLFAKRLDKGRFAAVADRARNRSVKLTLSELTQFIEGSDWIGRSPALLTWADLTPRWPEPEKK